jgi:hypothetical protein
VHVTAGFGDVGFRGFWTLEMFAVQPIRIYAGTQICQIFYHTMIGRVQEYCSGKYQNNRDIQPSLMYREFGREEKISSSSSIFSALAPAFADFLEGLPRIRYFDVARWNTMTVNGKPTAKFQRKPRP